MLKELEVLKKITKNELENKKPRKAAKGTIMYDMTVVKEKIKELEKELKNYKKILVDLCPHENVSPIPNDYNSDRHFICDDCGMTFITDDAGFKYITNLII